MSFSDNTSGDFRDTFTKVKRRLVKTEISKDDKESLQGRVNNLRSQIDFVECYDYIDNLSSNPTGPNDFIFEPDNSEVKAFAYFADIYGDPNYGTGTVTSNTTLNGVAYDAITITDSSWKTKTLYYLSSTGTAEWNWEQVHPPSVKNGASLRINTQSNERQQLIYYDNYGTDFDFASDNFSMFMWVYLTELPSTVGSKAILACRNVDGSNRWTIEIDTDNKIFAIVNDAGLQTKRQYDTAITADSWIGIGLTWVNTGPTVNLRVNKQADTSSTKTTSVTDTTDLKMSFGGKLGGSSTSGMRGYLGQLIYYKHSTVLTNTELDRVYDYGTKTDTTEPCIWGFMQFG